MIFKRCFRALDGHSFQYSYIKGIPAPCVHVWRLSICHAETYISPLPFFLLSL